MARNGTDGPWRAEWRRGDRVEVVARLESAFPHHSSLDSVLARLHEAGKREGELLLVEEASGAVAARRRLDQPVRRWTPPAHQRGGPAPTRPNGAAPLTAADLTAVGGENGAEAGA